METKGIFKLLMRHLALAQAVLKNAKINVMFFWIFFANTLFQIFERN